MTAYDYNSSLTLKDIDYINVNEMKEPVFQRSGLCRVLQDQEDQDPELLSDQVWHACRVIPLVGENLPLS